MAMLLLPACGSSDGGTSASGGSTSASGGSTSASGGTSVNGGSTSGGTASGGSTSDKGGTSTDTAGAPGSGGNPVTGGTGGSSFGGSAAAGSHSGGAAGGSAGAGMGGTGAGGGASGGAGGAHGIPKALTSLTSIPSTYSNPIASPGKWTSTTYPCYYHGSGSIGQVIAKQSTPITKAVNIYTPPGYNAQTEYPLIFFLHGYPDNQNTWHDRAMIKPEVLLDNMINAKLIRPIIGVWPMGSSTNNASDTNGYAVFDNELFGDLVPFLESMYSIKKDRNSWAMSGFSYGGMQTINIFLCHHLKDFGWFGGYSPAGGNYASDAIASCLKAEDPATYPVNYFYVQSGPNELATGSAAASANGLTTKAAPTITSANFEYIVTNGGHDYDNDTIGLYNFVQIAFPY